MRSWAELSWEEKSILMKAKDLRGSIEAPESYEFDRLKMDMMIRPLSQMEIKEANTLIAYIDELLFMNAVKAA